MNDEDGKSTLVDVGALLGIPTGLAVQTFHIDQANDLTLYLAACYRYNQDESALTVARPFRPGALLKKNTLLPLVPGVDKFAHVEKIYMVSESSRHVRIVVFSKLSNTMRADSDQHLGNV